MKNYLKTMKFYKPKMYLKHHIRFSCGYFIDSTKRLRSFRPFDNSLRYRDLCYLKFFISFQLSGNFHASLVHFLFYFHIYSRVNP